VNAKRGGCMAPKMTNKIDEEIIAEWAEQRRQGTEMEGLVPVTARVTKNPMTIYSVRFSEPEMQLIEAQADREQKRLSVFIREAALKAAVEGTAVASEGKIELAPSEQETLFQALRQVIATKPETRPTRRTRRSNTAAQKA
jgi:uncharacterized protein (DUF1778 family)